MKQKTIRTENLKKDATVRLNRIEGQVKGVNKMLADDAYCNDILTQISSIQSALNSVSKIILENHIKSCVVDKIKNDDSEVVEELVKTIGRLL